MKALIAMTLIFSSIYAQASHFGDYTAREINLANKLLACSSKVTSLNKQGFKKIVKASFEGGMTPSGVATTYTVVFSKDAAGASATKQQQLKIDELISQDGAKAYECTITAE